jgi:hypothetical protein
VLPPPWHSSSLPSFVISTLAYPSPAAFPNPRSTGPPSHLLFQKAGVAVKTTMECYSVGDQGREKQGRVRCGWICGRAKPHHGMFSSLLSSISSHLHPPYVPPFDVLIILVSSSPGHGSSSFLSPPKVSFIFWRPEISLLIPTKISFIFWRPEIWYCTILCMIDFLLILRLMKLWNNFIFCCTSIWLKSAYGSW